MQPTIADTQAAHGVTVCSDTYILARQAGSYLQSKNSLEQSSGQALPDTDQQILIGYKEQFIGAAAYFHITTTYVAWDPNKSSVHYAAWIVQSSWRWEWRSIDAEQCKGLTLWKPWLQIIGKQSHWIPVINSAPACNSSSCLDCTESVNFPSQIRQFFPILHQFDHLLHPLP